MPSAASTGSTPSVITVFLIMIQQATVPTDRSDPLLRAAPAVFVLLWSTGWIVAGLAARHADPLTFLSIRFAIAAGGLGLFALAVSAPWPRGAHAVHAVISGVLLHGLYLGSVWWAVKHGVPAVMSGLLAAVQPILTALLAPSLLGERITRRQALGIAAGFVGVALVLGPRLAATPWEALGPVVGPLLVNVLGMVSVTFGTFYQKRFIPTGDLRTVTVLQYVGAVLTTLPAAWLIEDMRMDWNLESSLVMAWSVVAISFGAIGLLLMLIRRGAVSRAAALIYLVPPTVAVQGYLMFGETLGMVQLVGVAVTVAGVALTTRR